MIKKIIVILLLLATGVFLFLIINKNNNPLINNEENKNLNNFSFSESPILKDLVNDKIIPEINERLPKNPMIIIPLNEVGEYGGTWNLQAKSKGDHNLFLRVMGYENLVRWNSGWTDIIPNIAKSFEVSPSAKEFTFYLREGMRWSDGEFFTADDILFWYEDILLDKNLTPAPATWLSSGGNVLSVEKIDDYTVKFIFSEANSQFLQSLAHPKGGEITSYPKHYLKKFLPKYNPEIETLVKEGGFNDYKELFINEFGIPGTPDELGRWQKPKVPTLNAWIFKNEYGKEPIIFTERNPFYWKIDIAGQQLPYIDNLRFVIEDDSDKIVKMAIEGEIDMQDRNIGNEIFSIISRKELMQNNADKGGYRLFKTIISSMNTNIISFNMNHKDLVLREIFQNKNFRIAMSQAINRERIINEVFSGQGKPYQGAPRPESPFYDEEMATQYTEYNIEKANELLDEIGLQNKDSDGFRLLPNGKRLSIVIDWGDPKVLSFIIKDWGAVGVEAKIGNTSNRDEFYNKKNNKLHDVAIWKGDGGLEVIQEPRFYFPSGLIESNYAIGWDYWFISKNHPLAEEPSPAAKKQMELYQELMREVDMSKQNELMKKILEIAKEEFYVIGISLPIDGFGIVNKNFKNVPEAMPSSYVYPTPAPTNPIQYFIKK